ncbi:MAG TPA: hypothetical protein VJ019_09120, partial [Aestuariivirga sp.]|nr:hypothetical protein [Aestuariivirga sp.]
MLQLDLIGNSQVWETEELCCAWGGYGDSTAKRKEMQIISNERQNAARKQAFAFVIAVHPQFIPHWAMYRIRQLASLLRRRLLPMGAHWQDRNGSDAGCDAPSQGLD